MQKDLLYPQIAERDNEEACTDNWLQDLENHKQQWMDAFSPSIISPGGIQDQVQNVQHPI